MRLPPQEVGVCPVTPPRPFSCRWPPMKQAGLAVPSQSVDGETEACSGTRAFARLSWEYQPCRGSSGASRLLQQGKCLGGLWDPVLLGSTEEDGLMSATRGELAARC